LLVRQFLNILFRAFGKKIRRSISPTKFKPNLYAEIRQTLFAVRQIASLLCVQKIRPNILVKLTPNQRRTTV